MGGLFVKVSDGRGVAGSNDGCVKPSNSSMWSSLWRRRQKMWNELRFSLLHRFLRTLLLPGMYVRMYGVIALYGAVDLLLRAFPWACSTDDGLWYLWSLLPGTVLIIATVNVSALNDFLWSFTLLCGQCFFVLQLLILLLIRFAFLYFSIFYLLHTRQLCLHSRHCFGVCVFTVGQIKLGHTFQLITTEVLLGSSLFLPKIRPFNS